MPGPEGSALGAFGQSALRAGGTLFSEQPTAVAPASSSAGEKLRLDYLDGIRGLSALYIVVVHADITHFGVAGIPSCIVFLLPWLRFFGYAVAFFIVLSGYCLMLPVARSADGQLRGGTVGYIRRRARRILPPYYAALVFSLLIDASPAFHPRMGLVGETIFPAFAPKSILAHLLLVHNFSPHMLGRIDPPMWSIALEWQIYFLFALLFLPLWRRFGIGATLLCTFAIGLAPHFLIHGPFDFDWTHPWYIGLFAVGMAAALVNFRQEPKMERLRTRVPWILLPIVLFLAIGYIGFYQSAWELQHLWVTDSVVGIGAAGLLVYCTQQLLQKRRPLLVRLLTLRPIHGLGTISFSIYLTHYPLLIALEEVLVRQHPSPLQWFVVTTCGFIPFSVLVAYLFHLAFERRFMTPVGDDRSKLRTP